MTNADSYYAATTGKKVLVESMHDLRPFSINNNLYSRRLEKSGHFLWYYLCCRGQGWRHGVPWDPLTNLSDSTGGFIKESIALHPLNACELMRRERFQPIDHSPNLQRRLALMAGGCNLWELSFILKVWPKEHSKIRKQFLKPHFLWC